jgi:hypothetical protein
VKTTDDYDTLDDAADTLRFGRPAFDFEAPTDPDATSIYDITPITPTPVHYVGRSTALTRTVARRRRQIRDTRENVLRLRAALAAGWDIAPELAHEERQLAALEAR